MDIGVFVYKFFFDRVRDLQFGDQQFKVILVQFYFMILGFFVEGFGFLWRAMDERVSLWVLREVGEVFGQKGRVGFGCQGIVMLYVCVCRGVQIRRRLGRVLGRYRIYWKDGLGYGGFIFLFDEKEVGFMFCKINGISIWFLKFIMFKRIIYLYVIEI